MKQHCLDKEGRRLAPLRIDRNTVILVPEGQATEERAERYRKYRERSRKIATCNRGEGYY